MALHTCSSDPCPTCEWLQAKLLTSMAAVKFQVRQSPFMAEFTRRRPTVFDVERDVRKLKSVSAAGRAMIVDERCAWLSIGRHAGTIRLRRRWDI